MQKQRIVLASGSPRRSELLKQVGIEFEVIPAQGEEDTKETAPERVVTELSKQKALEVAERLREADAAEKTHTPWMSNAPDNKCGEETIVIAADTIVAFDGRILGKPQSKEDAVKMLKMLSDHTHQVFTGVTICRFNSGECKSFFEKTDVVFYPLSEKQILDYVATGEPMDKAGAYGIQGKGAVLVKKINGDYNNVVGLPLARLCRELEK